MTALTILSKATVPACADDDPGCASVRATGVNLDNVQTWDGLHNLPWATASPPPAAPAPAVVALRRRADRRSLAAVVLAIAGGRVA